MVDRTPPQPADGTPAHGYTPLEVTRAVRRLDMCLADMHLTVSERMGVTAAELLAVAYMGMDGAQGPTELAHRLHMRTGAVTALVDRLEGHGYAVRTPHPTDRRKLSVALTEAGRRDTMVELGGMVDDVIAYVKTLSPADQQTVGRFIDGLVAVIATGRQSAAPS